MRAACSTSEEWASFTSARFSGGWIGYSITGLAPAVHIPLMLLCGFIGGALYALPPALLKIYLGANELISTIMLNSIAAQILSCLSRVP
jgi:simple sugar transport system permease protein